MIRVRMQSFKMRRGLWAGALITWFLGGVAVKAVAASGSFALTGSLNTARYGHTATLLQNGEVLVTGGVDVTGNANASAELYKPTTGKWTVTGSMSDARTAFTATLLQNGEVLVAGGYGFLGECLAAAELYNPSTGEWTPTGTMTQGRCSHSASLLPSGEVLVAGGAGTGGFGNTLASAELYNPSTVVWQTTGSLNVGRSNAAAILENGQVLVAGGSDYSNGIYTIPGQRRTLQPIHGLVDPHRQHVKGYAAYHSGVAYEH
jgi:Galactose oxidase, central domain/Kelch motif